MDRQGKPSMRNQALPLLILAAGAVGLAACSSGRDERPLPCPTIAATPGAMALTRFVGNERDLTDVAFAAQVESATIECTYESDNRMIDATLQVVVGATRGPANPQAVADFAYFVGVTNDAAQPQVLTRDRYPVQLRFEGNATRVAFRDQIAARFPLKEGETGANYRVYIGLELTPAELEYNRQSTAKP